MPPGKEDKTITMDERSPSAIQAPAGTPIEPKRAMNAYSRNPIPFRLIGIIEMRVMTGTKIMK